MGRKPKKKSSFITVVTDDFLNKFCVPQPFLKNFTDGIIPKEVYFKRSMKCWVVKLEKIENKLYFRKGLKFFVKENNIGKGDYIVFKLLRGSVFKFTIYDQTFCEKERFNKIIIPQVNTVEEKSAKLLSGRQNIGRDGCDHVNAKGKKLEESPDDPISSKCRYFTSIFFQDQAPDFPEWFIEKLREELKCVFHVKVRCGEYCELELTKVNSKILLRGWKSFVAKNSIHDGQCLKFKYVLRENEYEDNFEEGMDYLVSEEEFGGGCSGGGGSKEVFNNGSEEPSMTKEERRRIYTKPGIKATNKSIKISGDERVKKKHYTEKRSFGMNSAAENIAATASTSKPASTHFLDFMEDFRKNMYQDEDEEERMSIADTDSAPYLDELKEERMSIADTDSAPYLGELKRSGTEYTEYLLVYIKELALGSYNEFNSGVSINNCIDKTITAEKPRIDTTVTAEMPRRPLNAYMIFMETFRKMYVIKYPKSAAKDNGIAGGEKWRSMTDAERAPYIAESEKRTDEYKKQLKAFYGGRAVGNDINDGAVLYNSESEVNKNGKKERTCKEDKGNCYQSESESDSKMVYESVSSEEENTDEDSHSYNSISAYNSDDNGEEMRSDEDKPIKELASKGHKAITEEKIKFRNTHTTEYPNSQAKENGIAGGEKWRSMTKSEKDPSFSSFLKAQNGKKYYKHPDSERTTKHGKRKATKSPGNKPKRPANKYFGLHAEEFRTTYKAKISNDPSMETGKASREEKD